jgi:(5-formylfuran-3-yl)methyl phosphate synthase
LKLLISPKNQKEAKEATAGGAHIIDIKNPQEGALGANYPWVIQDILKTKPPHVQVSCTLGDAPNLPGTFALAATGAASLGVDYIKVGLYGVKTEIEAVFFLTQTVKAAKAVNPKIKIAATGYADAQKIGALNPMLVPTVAAKAGADIAMIDTYSKNGRTLLDHLTIQQLEMFVQAVHSHGLEAALAGSLRKQDLATLFDLSVDIAGFRGAVCTASDRNSGEITRELVADLVTAQKQLETQRK